MILSSFASDVKGQDSDILGVATGQDEFSGHLYTWWPADLEFLETWKSRGIL